MQLPASLSPSCFAFLGLTLFGLLLKDSHKAGLPLFRDKLMVENYTVSAIPSLSIAMTTLSHHVHNHVWGCLKGNQPIGVVPL